MSILPIPKPFNKLPQPAGFEQEKKKGSREVALEVQSAECGTYGYRTADSYSRRRMFHLADSNGDGVLSGQEIRTLAAQVSEATGMPVSEEAALATCDLDGDGQIAEGEWQAVTEEQSALCQEASQRYQESEYHRRGIRRRRNSDRGRLPRLPRPF